MPFRPATPCSLLALSLALAGVSFADDPSNSADQPEIVSFDFQDVAVEDYLEFMNDALPENQQAICTKAAENVTLPRINKLKCRADIAVRLLEPITANGPQPLKVTSLETDDGPRLLVVDLANPERQPIATAVSVRGALRALRSDSEHHLGPKHSQSASEAKERLISTLESGLKATLPEHVRPVVMKFHDPSGLLFIKGAEAQVKFVREVIAELTEQ